MIWKINQTQAANYCEMCGATSSNQVVVRPDGLPIHECSQCGFCFLANRPDSKALSEYYDNDYFQNSQTYQDYYNYAQAIFDLNYCPRLQQLAPFILTWKNKKVLDIGCAAGGSLALLRKKGALVTGIEISKDACRAAFKRFRLEVINKSLENIQLSDESFDVVMMFDVLEHLQRPGKALEHITDSLQMGGHLALTVPNFNRFSIEGLNWLGLQKYWEHINYFKSSVLCDKLSKLGFDIIELHSYTMGLPEKSRIRDLLRVLKKQLPFIETPLRLIRKVKFGIKDPPRINTFNEDLGMDLFILAQKSKKLL